MGAKNIKLKAFTIVELLVGILAAITIVSYSGISGRAQTSTNLANANAVLKAAESVRGDTSITTYGGYYPDITTAAGIGTNQQSALLNVGAAKIPSGLSVTGKATNASSGTLPSSTTNSVLLYVINSNTYTAATGICVYYFDVTSNTIKSITSGNATAATGLASGVNQSNATCS